MKSIKLILIILAILTIAFTAEGKVIIKGGCKNREADIKEVVTINNASYQSSSLLLPYTGYMGSPSSFLSTGNGKIENGSIFHSIEALTNVKSENNVVISGIGGVKWGRDIEVSNGKATSQLNVEIDNGKCIFNSKNEKTGVTNEISLNNTKLNAKSKVSDDEIQYTASIKASSDENREFHSKMVGKNSNKIAEVEGYLKSKPIEGVPSLSFDCTISAVFNNNGSISQEINIYSKEGFQINTLGVAGNSTSITTLMKSYVKKENGETLIPTQYVPDTGEPLNVNIFPVEGVPIKQKLTLEVNVELWK